MKRRKEVLKDDAKENEEKHQQELPNADTEFTLVRDSPKLEVSMLREFGTVKFKERILSSI